MRPRALRIVALVGVTLLTFGEGRPDTVKLVIENESDVQLSLYWLHMSTLHTQTSGIPPGGKAPIDAYQGHSFVVFDTSKEGHGDAYRYDTVTADKTKSTMFTMPTLVAHESVVVYRDQDTGILTAKSTNDLTKMKQTLSEAAKTCGGGFQSSESVKNELIECLSYAATGVLSPAKRELDLKSATLQSIGDKLREYQCKDTELETTSPPRKVYAHDDKNVSVLYEGTASSIMLIDDFVSENECAELMKRTDGQLEAAMVTEGGNEGTLSTTRKAKQGAVTPDYNLPEGVDLLADLYNRAYKFANHATGYGLGKEGQEGVHVIKYDHNGEYLPHCDGACAGKPHLPGGRVATLIMYCVPPDAGGGTTFASADIFIRGKRGQAVFFSYYDKETGLMDTGMTRHSGCPVLAGEKWIATIWMRKGVTRIYTFRNRPNRNKICNY